MRVCVVYSVFFSVPNGVVKHSAAVCIQDFVQAGHNIFGCLNNHSGFMQNSCSLPKTRKSVFVVHNAAIQRVPWLVFVKELEKTGKTRALPLCDNKRVCPIAYRKVYYCPVRVFNVDSHGGRHHTNSCIISACFQIRTPQGRRAESYAHRRFQQGPPLM